MSFRLPFAGPPGARQADAQADFVHTDITALAAHMQRCATSRGRWFALRDGLQAAHALVAGRIVTLALAALVIALALLSVA